MTLTKRALFVAGAVALTVVPIGREVSAHAPSGAIFTTVEDGTEVNLNQYAAKKDVYLDGGPGPGAPQDAAGLDDDTYVFQVTNPSGKDLLSEDPAECRQFTVVNGVIDAVVDTATDCQHATGFDVDHEAATVQLIPYKNTTNHGGVYKVWVTRLEDFVLGCNELGMPGNTGLFEVDCGFKEGDNAHGFIPAHSKTDNFKVKSTRLIREIDAVFYKDTIDNNWFDWGKETQLTGLRMEWTDPVGAGNRKHSYFLPSFNIRAAHVEAVENGVHFIDIPEQAGCNVGEIYVNSPNSYTGQSGPQRIRVDMNASNADKDVTVQIWVECT